MSKLRLRKPIFWTPEPPQVPVTLGCFHSALLSFAVRETEAQSGDINEDSNPQHQRSPFHSAGIEAPFSHMKPVVAVQAQILLGSHSSLGCWGTLASDVTGLSSASLWWVPFFLAEAIATGCSVILGGAVYAVVRESSSGCENLDRSLHFYEL